MKKRALLGAICALSFSQLTMAEGGFYLGLKGGGETVSSKLESGSDKIEDLSASDGLYGTYFGYAFSLGDGGYFGIEAEYTSRNAELKYNIAGFEERITYDSEYGVNMILNLRAHDNLGIYGLVGTTKAKVKGKTNTGLKGDDKVKGTAYGLGLEFSNDSQIKLRAEYRYTKYQDIDIGYGVDMDDKPRSHAITLGVHYFF